MGSVYNQGFLFQLSGKNNHLFLTEGYKAGVENNKIAKEKLSQAQKVCFESPVCDDYAITMEWTRRIIRELPNGEISQSDAQLLTLLEEQLEALNLLSPEIKNEVQQGLITDKERFFIYTILFWANLFKVDAGLLQKEFSSEGKEVSYLLNEEEFVTSREQFMDACLPLLSHEGVKLTLKFLLKDSEAHTQLQSFYQGKHRAWAHGDMEVFGNSKHLLSAINNPVWEGKSPEDVATLLKAVSEAVDQAAHQSNGYAYDLLKKVVDRAHSETDTFFVLKQPILATDKQKKIQMILTLLGHDVKQLKTSTKPIGFFYSVTDKEGRKGYLYGSMHETSQEHANLNSRINQAFDKSGVLCTERTNVDPLRSIEEFKASADAKKLAELMATKSEDELTRISDLICEYLHKDGSTYKKDSNHSPYEALFRAYFEFYAHLQKSSERTSGIEIELEKKATAQGKPIESLESAEVHAQGIDSVGNYILGLLIDFLENSEQLNAEYLSQRIEEREKQFSFTEAVIRNGYDELLFLGLEKSMTPEQKKVHARRNMVMSLEIDTKIQKRLLPFSVVGAGHLFGKGGMLELLQNLGYTVKCKAYEEIIEEM